MPLADEFHNYDKSNTLWDRETWEALFGEAARADQALADSVALLLKDVLIATVGRRRNIEKLRNTAKEGIEWIWPMTRDHELSFTAFLYSIEGLTVGGHEPVDLLKEAIAVAEAHLAGEDVRPAKCSDADTEFAPATSEPMKKASAGPRSGRAKGSKTRSKKGSVRPRKTHAPKRR
ncbi:MAG TPA: hypothetical protein VI756_07585 [Blastocatellia bacterium]